MKARKLAEKGLTIMLAGFMLASLLMLSSGARAGPLAQELVTIEGVAVLSPVLHYQGRLLSPRTGSPVQDGDHLIRFSIYDTETGGSPRWVETKNVGVTNGLFTTLLGDTVPLDPNIFDGRPLWLGVAVGSDPEAVPRQRIAHSAYALHSEHASQASELNGLPPSAFAGAVHEHRGEDITSGVVAAPRIDPALAHDEEVMPIVLGSDGAGSGLDADLLDGQDSSAFAAASHAHDNRYYTKAESDDRFVNATGDTMTGVLTVLRIAYSAPRTQYLVIGGEGFVPGSNVDYINTYGEGGAYIVSGSGALVAPVHLPQGAIVTEFKVFFYDNSASDMIVYLESQGMSSSYFFMAEVSSAGIWGYGNSTATNISGNPIDNTAFSYLVYAYCSAWDYNNLRIKGVLITYTISEAP